MRHQPKFKSSSAIWAICANWFKEVLDEVFELIWSIGFELIWHVLGVNQYRWSKLWAWNPKNRQLSFVSTSWPKRFFFPEQLPKFIVGITGSLSFRSTQLTSVEAANYQLAYFITHARLHSPTFFFFAHFGVHVCGGLYQSELRIVCAAFNHCTWTLAPQVTLCVCPITPATTTKCFRARAPNASTQKNQNTRTPCVRPRI